MSIIFTEDRGVPSELRNGDMSRYAHYAAGPSNVPGQFTEAGAVAFVNAISPFEFLKGLFITKPQQEQAAQVALAQTQAGLISADTEARQRTTRLLVGAGAGLAGLMAIALILRGRRSSVAGYHRSRRSRRRRN